MAVRQTGLSSQAVEECVARQLVVAPLSDADLSELRRIRRLQELGVNMPGIEIVLHMRRRIQALQAELDRLDQGASHSGRPQPRDREQQLLPLEPEGKMKLA